jgi:predicted DNA repair protein MutK
MKALGILGTIAMFLVGGGIISHGIPSLHHFAEAVLSNSFLGTLFDGSIGILCGAIAFAVVHFGSKLRNKQ